MFFVWFYAPLPVARKSGQGFNARSFADKPCVAHSFGFSQPSRVLPSAITACVPWRLVLLPLRHVHKVHHVHQVHLAKCFVIRLAPQLLMGHFSEFYLFRLLTFDSVLSIFVVDTLFYLREETT